MSEVLRVVGAKHRDAGRGIARIDSKEMEKFGLVSGDIIEIKGNKTAYAIVWPSYPEDAGNKTIRIDGNVRNNADVGIDDSVQIVKAEASDAKRVDIAPTRPVKIVKGSEYLGKVLKGQPVVEDQQIRVDILSTPLTFIVSSTQPPGPVMVTPETRINLATKPVEELRTYVTYEDVGGLKREVGLVREMIELPMKHPELFQKIGIEPPQGVLLHGPPGTGKTLISKAVANETDANFYFISGPEIIGKYYGESEARLREIFEEAESNTPAVILIDELDSIAPKRPEMTGERMVERRVVAQLLALMDGLKSRGKVVVIGATNQPGLLDPALRRGGRFDRELEIGVPDRDGRKEILEIHTRGMPLADNVDLDKFADLTHGYVGADLAALTREAAMHSLRMIMPKIDLEGKIPTEVLDSLEISREDFFEALKTTTPSAMREVFTEVAEIKWNDVGGLENAKRKLREAIEWPLKYPEAFDQFGANPAKGVMLIGPPGTGKTLLAKAVANESEANFISIKGPELLSKFIGESERGVREMFRKGRQASPCVIFFDEIDAMCPTRTQSFDSHVSERVVSQVLTELDGLEELEDVVMIGATNRPDILDKALLRPGRIDHLIYTPPPDKKAREEIFNIHLQGKPIADDVDVSPLAAQTKGYVGADIAAICQEATMTAIREVVVKGEEIDVEELGNKRLEKKHLEQALERINPSVSKEALQSYERTMSEFVERRRAGEESYA